jgi:hypothetical protein
MQPQRILFFRIMELKKFKPERKDQFPAVWTDESETGRLSEQKYIDSFDKPWLTPGGSAATPSATNHSVKPGDGKYRLVSKPLKEEPPLQTYPVLSPSELKQEELKAQKQQQDSETMANWLGGWMERCSEKCPNHKEQCVFPKGHEQNQFFTTFDHVHHLSNPEGEWDSYCYWYPQPDLSPIEDQCLAICPIHKKQCTERAGHQQAKTFPTSHGHSVAVDSIGENDAVDSLLDIDGEIVCLFDSTLPDTDAASEPETKP